MKEGMWGRIWTLDNLNFESLIKVRNPTDFQIPWGIFWTRYLIA